LYGESWKDTPINSKLGLELDMEKSKDVQLLEDLHHFTLPPFYFIKILNISKAAEEVRHFLCHSIGQLKQLSLNPLGKKLDGSEWKEAIVKVLSSVEKRMYLYNFSFSKEHVEDIVNNSLHLERL
jgi:hypothetical protein